MVQHLSQAADADAPPTESAGPRRGRPGYRGLFALLAAANLAAALWVVYDETETRRPYKRYQRQFNALLGAIGVRGRPPRIVQLLNPALGVVDRCPTCHVAVDRPGFELPFVPRVLRTHPRRAELLGNHPPRLFGCTPCHDGQGRQTKGVGGARFAHGRNDTHWPRPLRSRAFVQASCQRCHASGAPIAGAPLYNRGRALFEQRRCFGCHRVKGLAPSYAAGPSLATLRAKTSATAVARWLRDPRAARADARMPAFWPKAVARSSGSGASGRSAGRREEEIAAIAALLGSLRAPASAVAALDRAQVWLRRATAAGQLDAAKGRALFDQLGCRACHALGGAPAPAKPAAPSAAPNAAGAATGKKNPRADALVAARRRRGRHGPALERVGERASAPWLAAWLRAPRRLDPRARMPTFELTTAQRAALVAFLVARRRPGHAPMSTTPRWPAPDAARVRAGRALVERYGCHGCHELPGVRVAGRAGPDLDGFGDRSASRLDFGDAKAQCQGSTPGKARQGTLLECFTLLKLRRPRSVASARLRPVMPDHRLAAAEARALAVFVLAQRSGSVARAFRHRPSERVLTLHRGERLLAQHNCRGCHEIGRVRRRVRGPDGDSEVRTLPLGGDIRRRFAVPSLAPPPLTFAGEKFRYRYLYGFLGAPERVRPWLVARMPRFALGAAQRARLVRYFATRNGQPFPFEREGTPRALPAASRAKAQWLFDKMQCAKCHRQDGVAKLKPGELAPDLALSRSRLQLGWLRRWLLAPQALQPGTRMPSFFPLADDDDPKSFTTPYPEVLGGDVRRQVDALARLTLGPPSKKGPAADGGSKGKKTP